MESKTSYFNSRLYKRDLKTYIPFMAIFIIGMLIVFIVPMYFTRSLDDSMAKENVNAILYLATNPVLIGIISVLAAVFSFLYLYKRRSAYMLHAFPVSRTGHFVSHFLAGLTMVFIIGIAAYLCAFMLNYTSRAGMSNTICYCFLDSVIETIFFYSLAVFVCMVCGNAILSVITFGVLNALWLFINVIIAMIRSLVVAHPVIEYSANSVGFMVFDGWGMDGLFPALYFLKRVGPYNEVYLGTSRTLDMATLGQCALMLIPAFCLIALSLLLYKRRKMEKVGEIVAFDWCRVVFRVMVTVCGAALISAIILIPVVEEKSYDVAGNAGMVSVFMALSGCFSFIVSEMILNKSIHVFKKNMPVLQGVIPVVAIIFIVILAAGGVFTPKAIPDADDVTGITITPYYEDENNRYSFSDKDSVERILASQEKLLNDDSILEESKKFKQGTYYNEYTTTQDDSYNISVRVYREDRQIRQYEYQVGKENLQKITNSYMPVVNESQYIEKAVFGQNPDELKVTEVRFEYLHNQTGITWNGSVLKYADGYYGDDAIDEESEYEVNSAVSADGSADNTYTETVDPMNDEHTYRIEGMNLNEYITDAVGVIDMDTDYKNSENIYYRQDYKINWTPFVTITPQSKNTLEVLRRYQAIK